MQATVPSQTSFAQAEYARKKKRTRREVFLEKMEQVVPWSRLAEVIEPHSPKGGKRGRPPIGLHRMLRMYFVQQWYGLADEAVKDALHDSQALRNFMGIDLSREGVPDATTLMGFRHLLEKHDLAPALLHGQEEAVWVDAGYVGVDKREDMQAALAAHGQEVQWHVARRRKTLEKRADGWQKDLLQAYEKLKAQVRARVVHPFHVVKNIFRHKKVRYKGIAKNAAQLNVLFALGNLYLMRDPLRP